MKNRSRRTFLAASGAAATASLLGPLFFEADKALGAVPVVRRNVGLMRANDPTLLAYRKAITAMQALPTSNPLSWTYQAAIHGTLLSTALTSWNTCEHGTDFFWSWHRMYLYWFERIIRKMCGEPCWALPYWDWAPGSDFHLPAPFRDTASELYTVNRDPAINSGAGSLNPLAVNVGPSFSLTNFFSANLSVQSPHGSVHTEVNGWMHDVPTAAQDPIFYVHHSNVDRLWNLWLAQGGGRSDPVATATWTNQQYTFFDENGQQVRMNACEILRAAQQLNYVYECEPPEVAQYCRRRPPFPFWEFVRELILRLPIPPVELKGEPVSFPIELEEIRGQLARFVESRTDTVLLELDDVEAEKQPGVTWAVYVGGPEKTEPKPESPHFVGTLSMFGVGVKSEKHHDYKPAHFVYGINRALQAALRANEERVLVTFVPLGIFIDGKPSRPEVKSPVRIGKASLSVERAKEVEGEKESQ